MAQKIEPIVALCPFYGSSNGCPYLDKCSLSHANPNSIELCPQYQTLKGCSNPSCYYRHSLTPLTKDQEQMLAKTHKIRGQIHYTRVIKGNAVHKVVIVISEETAFGIHLIIEDERMQKLHYQQYCSLSSRSDAILISEIIGAIILKSECPGKYLSYLKNLIDGNVESNPEQNASVFRDVLNQIGNDFNKIPKPENPRLVSEYNRVPWIDFKLHQLPLDVYDHPDIFLQPGDLVRVWRPKKLVYHCGIYLGNKQIIHISNGIKGDQGMEWKFSSLFQSGSAPPMKQFDDIEQNLNDEKCKKMDKSKQSELKHDDSEQNEMKNEIATQSERRARKCDWNEFLCGSRKKDLELGFFVFPWRKPSEIVYTAQFLTEIHYMKGHYSIMKNNCEHFALYCCTGLRHSPQANKIENIINVASKIGTFATSIFSKAASSIALIKSKKNINVSAEDDVSENHKNHPIINSVELDDGGDDELENMLLCESNESNQNNQRRKREDVKKKEPIVEHNKAVVHDLIDGDIAIQNKKNVLIDEYAEDEEDAIFEENMEELKMEDINHFDMTPGGLSQSEIFGVKKANDKNSWNI